MPLPNSRVIPAGWEAHHRPVPASASTATVTITRPSGPGTWNPSTGDIADNTPTVVYAGPARVQANTGRGVQRPEAADQHPTVRDYLVSIPDPTATVRPGDRVHVDTSTDPLLQGADLTVDDVLRGSLTWDRALACSLDVTNLPAA